MFCLRWVCRWNAPVPPSVSHLANGQLRKKSPLLAMPLTESRSEPKTGGNMPLLRQPEFAFQAVAASLWDASRFAQRSGYRARNLERKARELLGSLVANSVA